MLLCPHENRSPPEFSPGESPECHRRGDPNGDSSRAWFSIHIGEKRNDRSWTRTDVVDLRNEAIWKNGEIRRDPKSMASYWTIICFLLNIKPNQIWLLMNMSFLPRSHQLRIFRYKEHLEKHRKIHHIFACSLGPWVPGSGSTPPWPLRSGKQPLPKQPPARPEILESEGTPEREPSDMKLLNCWKMVMIDDWWLMIDDWWWMMDDGWWMIDDWWLMIDDWWLMIDDWWWMMDDGWWMIDDGWLMIDDWWLMIDDWWWMIDDWWLMIDGWWLMIDDWWLMIDDWWLMINDGWWMMDDGWWMMDDGWWMMDDGWWMIDDWWLMIDDDDWWLMIDDWWLMMMMMMNMIDDWWWWWWWWWLEIIEKTLNNSKVKHGKDTCLPHGKTPRLLPASQWLWRTELGKLMGYIWVFNIFWYVTHHRFIYIYICMYITYIICYTLLYFILLYYSIWYDIILYDLIWYYIYIILYYMILYYSKYIYNIYTG